MTIQSNTVTKTEATYALIAEALSSKRRDLYSSGVKAADAFDSLVAELADAFAQEDSNFSRAKFVDACLGPDF